MTVVSYKRSFIIHAAHWNNQMLYDLYWGWQDGDELTPVTWNLLVIEVHGHDFKIEVDLTADMSEDKNWIVDDVELEQLVKYWHNQNISTHPDFVKPRLRATTENMAQILGEKIHNQWPDILEINVFVHEGPDIVANCVQSYWT